MLIGDEGETEVVLSSPIILYDHPAVAPESVGDFCDATEIDEILALRVLTLTDDEKAERATDARAAIVDRCDDRRAVVAAARRGALAPAGRGDDTRARGLRVGPSHCRGGTRESTRRSTRGPTPRGSAGFRSARAHRYASVPLGAPMPTICSSPAARPPWPACSRTSMGPSTSRSPSTTTRVRAAQWQRRYLYFHPDEVEVLA